MPWLQPEVDMRKRREAYMRSDAKIIAGPGRDLKYLKLKLVVLG